MAIDSQEELLESFQEFFKGYKTDDGQFKYADLINRMIRDGDRSLVVDYEDLVLMDDTYEFDLADTLVEKPDFSFHVGSMALSEQVKIENFDYYREVLRDRDNFNLRFTNTPTAIHIRDLRSNNVDNLKWFEGIIIRTTEIKSIITEAVYLCNEEQHEIYLTFTDGIYIKPDRCSIETCKAKDFTLDVKQSKMIDWQIITLQEKPEDLPPGASPKSIPCRLVDDIVNVARPGDRVHIGGIVRTRPTRPLKKGQILTYDVWVDVNYLESLTKEDEYTQISPEEEKRFLELASDPKIHDHILSSVAPAIHGMEKVKEAVMAMLFAGVDKTFPDGFTTRGQPNILIVGDPGVAKCVVGSTRVLLADGSVQPISEIVNSKLESNSFRIDDGFYANGELPIITLDTNGKQKVAKANIFWKRRSPQFLYEVRTKTGKNITVTPTHPFFIPDNGRIISKRAKDLTIGEFIASPNNISVQSNNKFSVSIKRGQTNAKHINLPAKITPKLARFLGYVCGDGYVVKTASSRVVWFTNCESEILDDYEDCAYSSFGNITCTKRPSRKAKSARDIYITSVELGLVLEQISPTFYLGSMHKNVPNIIMQGDDEIVKNFLVGYFDSDGTVSKNRAAIAVTSASKDLLLSVQILLLRFNIISQLGYTHSKSHTSPKKKYYRLKITSINEFIKFRKNIGLNSYKRKRLNKSLASNSNIDVIPNIGELLQKIRLKLGISQFNMGVPRSTYQHYERGDRNPTRVSLQKIVNNMNQYQQLEDIDLLRNFSSSNIFWDQIDHIEKVESTQKWVYDLQVPKTHNFVADGIFVHNSQLLRYTQGIAPRGLYTSGKGSSAAGLTAAIIRDPDTSEITLEAGAMVLADRGLCMIDEFDKMTENDRSAIHEALEQHTVSVAKAGIVATLNARTGVLAAANPKYGRYESHRTFSENVNLTPAILSRFDLVFILRDEPEEEHDTVLAEHILRLHRFHGTAQSTPPPLTEDELKKYIAYAKTNYNPSLTEEASDALEQFYVEMRNSYGRTGENGSKDRVTITARQLEGIVRLAEARARAALRTQVTKHDALMAIELMRYSLDQIAIDPLTGETDIDSFYSGQTSSKRSKLSKLMSIIDFLHRDSSGRPFKEEDLIEEAEREGISREYVEGAIEQLKRDGALYTPKPGLIKKPDV